MIDLLATAYEQLANSQLLTTLKGYRTVLKGQYDEVPVALHDALLISWDERFGIHNNVNHWDINFGLEFVTLVSDPRSPNEAAATLTNLLWKYDPETDSSTGLMIMLTRHRSFRIGSITLLGTPLAEEMSVSSDPDGFYTASQSIRVNFETKTDPL